jgi:carbonic anhydrase
MNNAVRGVPIRKLFHLDLPHDKYKSDAAIVWCFDQRFELALQKLIKRSGIQHPDHIRVAGGAKSLANNDREGDRQFVLEQVQLSIRLHATDTVFLMLHSDCGAYGGLSKFDSDATKEAETLCADLKRASEFLQQKIPGIKVRTFFVNFEGVWEAEGENVITRSPWLPASAHN